MLSRQQWRTGTETQCGLLFWFRGRVFLLFHVKSLKGWCEGSSWVSLSSSSFSPLSYLLFPYFLLSSAFSLSFFFFSSSSWSLLTCKTNKQKPRVGCNFSIWPRRNGEAALVLLPCFLLISCFHWSLSQVYPHPCDCCCVFLRLIYF